MKTVTKLSIIAVTTLLIGCGGGSDNTKEGGSTSSDTTLSGHLVDSAVKGVFYSCGGPNYRGFTDDSGAFYCESSPVSFYIGKLFLGSVDIPTADGYVFPQDMVGVSRDDINNEEVIKVSQLFQSLDSDAIASNGIEITKAISDKYTIGTLLKNNLLDELLATAEVNKVDENSAIEHLKDSMEKIVSGTSSSSESTPVSTGVDSIDSANLAGKTLIAEYKSGVKIKDIKKTSYIFLADNKTICVFDFFDGSRKVARGVYNESDGNNVAIISPVFDNGETFVPAFGISTPNGIDKITVGKSKTFYTVTSIVDNADNGIDESTVTSTSSSNTGSTQNGDAVMYDEFYAKQLSIYNNVSSYVIDQLSYTYKFAGNSKYNSDTQVHCVDYGYKEMLIENTNQGVHVKTYQFPNKIDLLCMEYDYANSPNDSGSKNVVWYQK